MKILMASMIAKLNTMKLGMGIFVGLSGVTAMAVIPKTPWGQNLLHVEGSAHSTVESPMQITTSEHGVGIEVRQSQGKVGKHSTDEIYLDIKLDIPQLTKVRTDQRPTDLVLVLDRSGSMAEGNKMVFAKEAMRTFLHHLTEKDRVSLVIFDGVAEVSFPMTTIDAQSRKRLAAIIDNLQPGGATNIGEGLHRGRIMFPSDGQHRSRRLVLLSDGHANTGVSDIDGLSRIVRQISDQTVVVSTVGLGLGFNEELLARLSDYGMGNFTFLETAANLGEALRRDLENAREQFAYRSHLLLQLGESVSIIDAAGYPVEVVRGGQVRIPLGQLLEGTERNITIALRAPTSQLGQINLGKVNLAYNRLGKDFVGNDGQPLSLSVVETNKTAEITASIDKDLFQHVWSTANMGRMKKEFGEKIRSGRRAEAEMVLNNYRADLAQKGSMAGVNLVAPSVSAEIAELEVEAKDAFEGSVSDQAVKQKSLSKKSFASGLKEQRRLQKKDN